MKYRLDPAEKVRKELGLTPEQFSIRIDYGSATYRIVLNRGWMTRRMASEISRRYKIPLDEFRDGGKGN